MLHDLKTLRCRIERFLTRYPLILETTSAIVTGSVLAGVAFAASVGIVGLREALLLAIAALVIGGFVGWLLASMLLGFVFMAIMLFIPDNKGVVLASGGLALAGSVAHWLLNGVGFPRCWYTAFCFISFQR